MVERKTLYTVIIRLTGKYENLLAQAEIAGMKELKDRIKIITFNNGLDFSEHEKIADFLDSDIFLRIHMLHGIEEAMKIQAASFR